jgi:hypothetical protein
MRSGFFLPPFDALSDPGVVARLAIEAEEAGHGSSTIRIGGCDVVDGGVCVG